MRRLLMLGTVALASAAMMVTIAMPLLAKQKCVENEDGTVTCSGGERFCFPSEEPGDRDCIVGGGREIISPEDQVLTTSGGGSITLQQGENVSATGHGGRNTYDPTTGEFTHSGGGGIASNNSEFTGGSGGGGRCTGVYEDPTDPTGEFTQTCKGKPEPAV